jgi:tetratricopeptide (TPR) repeat protein
MGKIRSLNSSAGQISVTGSSQHKLTRQILQPEHRYVYDSPESGNNRYSVPICLANAVMNKLKEPTVRLGARPGQWLAVTGLLFSVITAWGSVEPLIATDPGSGYEGTEENTDVANPSTGERERQLNQLITDLEAAKGDYAPELGDPLLDLARIYVDTGRMDKARENLRRAQHLMHRQDGVHALGQLEIIDLLFDLDMQEGKFSQAENQQHFALFISEHNTGKDDPELLPALLKMARWQFETGQYQPSRQTLARARDIITTSLGPADPRLVQILVLEAQTRQLEGACCVEEILEEARAILEANPQQNDEYPALLFALADAYIDGGEPELAAEFYHQAVAYQTVRAAATSPGPELPPKPIPTYGQLNRFTPHKQVYVPKQNTLDYFPSRQALLERQGFQEQPKAEIFVIPFEDHQYNVRFTSDRQNQPGTDSLHRMVGDPIQFELDHLREILPASYLRDARLAETSIKLDFTVLATGKVTDLEIIAGDAPSKLNQLLKRALSMSKFRPRLVNGIAVDTQHVQIMQTFSSIDDIISPEEN